MTDQEILKELLDARSKSYSPYSKFAVGAIILTKDGRIIKGANLEKFSLWMFNFVPKEQLCFNLSF